MPGRFFNDLLEVADKTMGFDPSDDPTEESGPFRDWSFKLKAEPKKGVDYRKKADGFDSSKIEAGKPYDIGFSLTYKL